jgi:deoxyribodipyrimidine photolyase-related protein
MEKDGNPRGGKWTYDVDNRKKYPKGQQPPEIQFPNSSPYWEEAIQYVETYFKDYPGSLDAKRIYPITFEETSDWLVRFLKERFEEFGIYEDAIVKEEIFLNHSLLSPLMNAGLISPHKVINESLLFAEKNDIPLNSLEGFIRQIMGWREFIRGMYLCKGSFSRTQNFWGFERKIPKSFYDGTTGIEPLDDTIKKVLATGYCHHIERLMVLGNFMLLCEFHPEEVYRWFMELFIDAYDWVMVPNVYGMSQFADGGTFATKPYIGGSNYIKKMSNYGKGPWTEIWDGLFWRFISVNQDFFLKNPRMSMMVHSFNRMSDDKRATHLENAADFLAQLEGK